MLGSQDNSTDVSTQLLGVCVLSGEYSLSDFMKEDELLGDGVIRKTGCKSSLLSLSFPPISSCSPCPFLKDL